MLTTLENSVFSHTQQTDIQYIYLETRVHYLKLLKLLELDFKTLLAMYMYVCVCFFTYLHDTTYSL